MLYGVHLGANHRMDPQALREARVRGFTCARVEVSGVIDPDERRAIVQDLLDADLRPVVIVDGADQAMSLPPSVDVELLNELDGDVAPQDYAALVPAFVEACHARLCVPWIGVISNLDRDSLDWLDAVLVRIPPSTPAFGVSVHRYPTGREASTPHRGFRTRDAEVAELRGIIGGRRFAVTELGYHTAPQKHTGWRGWFGMTWRWTEADIARHLAWEWSFWATHGAEVAIAYCLNDGPDPKNALDRYGFRRPDGVWKSYPSM